jgi:glycine/D-amino acid oxidase-like deaminating enzyme/nitrite reductase/ring-hydroxylating ferredoxin subunit
MHTDSGKTRSIWMAIADPPAPGPLTQDVEADVCIVGGGIAGITTAYLLMRAGGRVVLIDDGPLTGGETSRTTAHLAFYIDDGLSEIERMHGLENLRLHVESHRAAVDRIESIARDEGIVCDFQRVDGYLFVSPEGEKHDYLEEEIAAAQRIGWNDVRWIDRAPLSFDTGRCLCFPRHGQFHPLKYLSGLLGAIARGGGQIHTHTHADEITGGDEARVVTRGGHTIRCRHVVVATNSPVNDRFAIHTKQAPYRTFTIGCRIPSGSVPPGLYWDTEDPYHYVRIQSQGDHDVLIVGGEDHKTAHYNDGLERFNRLHEWTKQRFPMAGALAYTWSGQVMEPVDAVAFIGRNPMDSPNVYVATGDSGMGMTHGTIAGMLLSDLILGRANPWEKLYDPSRASAIKHASEFAKENLDVGVKYLDWIAPGQRNDVQEIAPGSGAVIRRGLSKVAVHRDEQGQVHERSAVCPHLGCVVQWNDTEGSWDCPCHGSRFSPTGQVLNGPAIGELKEA